MPDGQFTNRLVFLHGFTQTHHHWHRGARTIAKTFGSYPSLTFVDLPGHGLSTDDDSGIEQVATSLPSLAGPGTWIGYSMGGRHALLVASTGAPEIERLVLIGATAGIDDGTDRADRAALDARRADHIESVGVETFLAEWLAAPMFAGLPDDPAGLHQRRRNTPAGLAHSLRTAGSGAQPSIWHGLDEIDVPTLVLAGDHDAKFTAIGRAMVERLPHATFVAIPDAGHAAQIEQPADVASVIAIWLESTA